MISVSLRGVPTTRRRQQRTHWGSQDGLQYPHDRTHFVQTWRRPQHPATALTRLARALPLCSTAQHQSWLRDGNGPAMYSGPTFSSESIYCISSCLSPGPSAPMLATTFENPNARPARAAPNSEPRAEKTMQVSPTIVSYDGPVCARAFNFICTRIVSLHGS